MAPQWFFKDLRFGILYGTLDGIVDNAFLSLDNRYMNNLSLLVWYMNIDVMINVNLVMTMLLLSDGHMNDLFSHHGYWYMGDLLNWLMDDTLLGYKCGSMDSLFLVNGYMSLVVVIRLITEL